MRHIAVIVALVAAGVVPLAAQDRRPVPSGPVAPSRRLALVIGNDTYAGSPLRNARNDARAMERALRGLSFDVTTVEDGTRVTIGSALLAFSRRLAASDLAFVFYAGHGVQVEGVNYLVPVDFQGRSEDEVRLNAVSADEITRTLRRARVGVLVLDACRDNPYSGQRSGSRGLAHLEAQGLLVAFATGAGQTASDAPGAANGIFTSELVPLLSTPGRGLRDTFFEVQRRVQARTNGRQFPAVYSQLVDDVVLAPGASSPPLVRTPPPAVEPQSQPRPADPGRESAPPTALYTPLQSRTVSVPIGSASFPALPGVSVKSRQQLTIVASGTVCYDSPGCTRATPPTGSGSGFADRRAPLPGAPLHSLVCRIGDSGTLVYVGDRYVGIAQRSGSVYCGMNEGLADQSQYNDNRGTWFVTVTVVDK